MQTGELVGVELELALLRAERERARKEREQQFKRRRLLLNKKLDQAVIDTVPQLKTITVVQEPTPPHRKVGEDISTRKRQNETGSASKSNHLATKSTTRRDNKHNDKGSLNSSERGKHEKKNTYSDRERGDKDEKYRKNPNKERRDNGDRHRDRDSYREKQTPSRSSNTSLVAYKNDYSQHFVDTKQRPQNFIRDAELADRFEE